MLSESTLTPTQSEHLKIVYFSANLLNHLIENLLDFSKLEKGKLSIKNAPFNFHSMLKYLNSFFGEFSKQKQIQFDMNIAPEIPVAIVSDKTRLTQVCASLSLRCVLILSR
jgi:signal transduction histidine kinase